MILPGSAVRVIDAGAIYFGYQGVVQRVSDGKAAVQFEGGPWAHLVRFPLSALEIVDAKAGRKK